MQIRISPRRLKVSFWVKSGSKLESECFQKVTSVGTSSFTARFYKGSLKVPKARPRTQNCSARSKFRLGLFLTADLGSNSLVHILKKLELTRLGKFTARANTESYTTFGRPCSIHFFVSICECGGERRADF